MADFSNTFTRQWSDGNSSLSGAVTVTGDAVEPRNITVGATTTNLETDISFTQAKVKGVFLLSDKALTLKTNSTGSPDDTIALVAGVPVAWANGDVAACPFTADVTKFYLTNGGASPAQFTCRILWDSTP